jgi:hypothetical protein
MASLLYEKNPQGQLYDTYQSRNGERWLLSNEQFFDAFVLGTEALTAQLLATEAADTAAFEVQSDETPVSLAATEQADVVSGTVTANARLVATESSDVLSIAVAVVAQLAAIEDQDSAAFAAEEVVDRSIALAVTELGDACSGVLEGAASTGGGGGTILRSSSPGSAYIDWYKSKLRKARKQVQAAKDDPLLAQKREFQQALSEAYSAFAALKALVEEKERAKLEREEEELRNQALQIEREQVALLEKKRLEESEDEELLAANLW